MKITEIVTCIDEYVEKNQDKLSLSAADKIALQALRGELLDLEAVNGSAEQIVQLIESAAKTIANPIPHPILSRRLNNIIEQF
jgi:predicted membrane chloride channel (bestrophin family)